MNLRLFKKFIYSFQMHLALQSGILMPAQILLLQVAENYFLVIFKAGKGLMFAKPTKSRARLCLFANQLKLPSFVCLFVFFFLVLFSRNYSKVKRN